MAGILDLYNKSSYTRPLPRMDNTRDYVAENYTRMGPVSIRRMDNTRDNVMELYKKMPPIKINLVDNKTDFLLQLYNNK